MITLDKDGVLGGGRGRGRILLSLIRMQTTVSKRVKGRQKDRERVGRVQDRKEIEVTGGRNCALVPWLLDIV